MRRLAFIGVLAILAVIGAGVFFFGGFYFQYKLNEINQIKQALRYRNSVR